MRPRFYFNMFSNQFILVLKHSRYISAKKRPRFLAAFLPTYCPCSPEIHPARLWRYNNGRFYVQSGCRPWRHRRRNDRLQASGRSTGCWRSRISGGLRVGGCYQLLPGKKTCFSSLKGWWFCFSTFLSNKRPLYMENMMPSLVFRKILLWDKGKVSVASSFSESDEADMLEISSKK